MQRVRSKNSDIEIMLRKALWNKNLRYQKNVKTIYGKPDIAFKGKKIAIFCDSEFWHGYDWENRKNDFKSNQKFWISKIERNMQRDNEVNMHLRAEGWIVLRFWGNDIKKNAEQCANIIEKVVKKNEQI